MNTYLNNTQVSATPVPSKPVLDMNDSEYHKWRDRRLTNAASGLDHFRVNIENPESLSRNQIAKIRRALSTHNIVVYQIANPKPHHRQSGRKRIFRFCQQLGLNQAIANPESDNHRMTLIEASAHDQTCRYIPYTSKPLKWHTDGYYNTAENQVRSFILHCENAALTGGENTFMDHELAFIQLRDQGKALARALCQDDVITIPENRENGVLVRTAFSGPVFSTDRATGHLYSRYSQRTRNIKWKNDLLTQEALDAFNQILDSENQWKIKLRLKPGEGILCNNILHCRSGFKNGKTIADTRSLIRIRFHDRIH